MSHHKTKYRQIAATCFFCLLCLLFLTLALYANNNFIGQPDKNRQINSLVPIAVLGDSDSHSYRDSYDNKERGGQYHAYSYNWIELWSRLAKNEINPGQWGTWGNHYRVARIKNLLMLKSRSPKKLDYEYNYAVSGLSCRSLLNDWPYQGKWLLNEIRSNTDYWNNGIVIIKIGYNDIGKTSDLKQWKKTGLSTESSTLVSNCTDSIMAMSDSILAISPSVKISIAGVARTYNFMDEWDERLDEKSIQNIEEVLSGFDSRLEKYASDRTRVAYIDDHFWFNNIFGSQESNDLKPGVEFSQDIELINASGDEPVNMLLADHHTGTLYNGLWINHLITEINRQLNMTLSRPELRQVAETAGLISD